MRLLIGCALLMLVVSPAGALLVEEAPAPFDPIRLEPQGDYIATAVLAPWNGATYIAFVEMNRREGAEKVGSIRFASWTNADVDFTDLSTLEGPELVDHLWILDLAIDPSGRMYVLRVIVGPFTPWELGLFTSADGGATWQPLQVPGSAETGDETNPGWGALAVDGDEALYLSTHAEGLTRVFRSTNHGDTFEPWDLPLDRVDTKVSVPNVTSFLNLREGVVDTDAAGGVAVGGRRLIAPHTFQHVSLSVAQPNDEAFSPQRVAVATNAAGPVNLAAGLAGHVTMVYDSGLGPGLVRAATTTDGGLTWINQALADWVAKDERVDIFMGGVGPGIAADDHGNVVAAWTQTDKATGVREIGYAASRDGGITWTKPGVLPTWTQPGIESVNAVVTIADGVAYILVRNGPGLAMYPVPLG